MKIRTKVIGLLAGLFVILGVTQLIVAERIFMPSFTELESDSAQTDMNRALHTLARELDLLQAMTADWGNWDAIYRYMQERKAEIVESSITPSSISGYRINAVALVGLDGKFVWTATQAPGTGAALDLDLIRRGRLPDGAAWQHSLATGRTFGGLLASNHGPMMVVAAPVLNGAGQGPFRGLVLIGRLLTAEEIKRIGAQAEVQLRMLPAANGVTGTQLVLHDAVTEISTIVRDAAGQPLFTLRVDVPREISGRGREVVKFASEFLIGAAIAALGLIMLILNSLVLRPLADVTQHVVAVGHSDDLTARLSLDRHDELGDLAREFDRMVAALGQARRQLVDNAFDSGVAENASGVLHNLGNAMTPLTVRVATLQKAIAAAPTADIALALAEIANAGDDAQRKGQLEEFLALAARELAKLMTSTQDDIDKVARQLQTIQTLLSQQAQHSRAPRALETVRLPELVAQSLELVGPAHRARLTVEVDESVQRVGALRLARTTMQQVFQNFIVNAAEATRDAGREQGGLRIAAEVFGDPATPRLRISFSDDGTGIPPESLKRIFEKGFSTKSSATNSGIGLHWCANVVGALGGSLHAESAGPGHGATLVVVLPLERPATTTVRDAA